jgi:hypothetical protein
MAPRKQKNVKKRTALMSSVKCVAWRVAAVKHGYFQKNKVNADGTKSEFKVLPKAGTPAHDEIKKLQAELVEQWTAAGGIPEEYRPKPTPVVEAEPDAAAGEKKKQPAAKPRKRKAAPVEGDAAKPAPKPRKPKAAAQEGEPKTKRRRRVNVVVVKPTEAPVEAPAAAAEPVAMDEEAAPATAE